MDSDELRNGFSGGVELQGSKECERRRVAARRFGSVGATLEVAS